MDNRQDFNYKILKILELAISSNEKLRFTQIINNLSLSGNFNEESIEIWRRLQNTKMYQLNIKPEEKKQVTVSRVQRILKFFREEWY